MKYKANGGYQILNFEGASIDSITSLDFKKIKDAILREKTFQIIGLSPYTDVTTNANCEVYYDADNDACIIKVADKYIFVSNDNSVVVNAIEYGTKVVANPTGIADMSLSSIQIGDDKYKVSQVSATSGATADETLEQLKIDGTIYDVGGTKLYNHTFLIRISALMMSAFVCNVILPTSTPLTTSTIADILKSTYKYSDGAYLNVVQSHTLYDTANHKLYYYGGMILKFPTGISPYINVNGLCITTDANGQITNFEDISSSSYSFDVVEDIVCEIV